MFPTDCSSKYRTEIIATNVSLADGNSMDELSSNFKDDFVRNLAQRVWASSPGSISPQSGIVQWNVRGHQAPLL